ncbi:ribonuclease P protein component [Bartonella tamiae]|uniref:Ribonuclease P protein component n=1 Tax=Bartonella tamiae Th239 TaxID=1094558 RepID=J1K046_9HYPH|nr:ribonuclease P protein component [Bartonella tamiae]EJF90380.1 ribonuclease P protein component [Bartonella tamiae Th239]EJF93676.1 ribonuclease P protein component [Bartonella tamiae Th307]
MYEKSPLRLRKRAEFLSLRSGEKRRGRFFLLEVKKRDLPENILKQTSPRVGFTVTRKNGNAVKRNRIKRRLREALRVGLTRDMEAGTDYVIVARPDALKAPFKQLIHEINRRIKYEPKN